MQSLAHCQPDVVTPRDRSAREASARDDARGPPTRLRFPTSAIRWRRASGAGGMNRRSDRHHRGRWRSLSWRSASRPRSSQASRAIVSCRPVVAGTQARS